MATEPVRWPFRQRAGPADPGKAYGAPGEGRSGLVSLATVLGLLFLWWAVTAAGLIKPLFLPSPQSVVQRFFRVLEEGFGGVSLWAHTAASLWRVFASFALACVTAIPIGIAMGVNRWARGIFDPPIEFYRPIPPLAYLPLTVIWFGIEELQKIVLIYLAIFAPMALSARAGVKSVTIEQIHAAYSMGASRGQVVLHVILPAALPEILTGMRIGIGFGWTTLVAAEIVAAKAGLGSMVWNAAEFLVTEVVIMGIVIIGAIAWAFDLLMRRIEAWAVPWKGRI
ncbi:MAG: taurine ABC transporter permease [Geminicoccaceae bacterium]|nr:MAG: taurine ABC transporter permease [Geminicoccaceae bacterium]